MKSGEGLAPFLGIEPGGNRGRADQTAKQHCQVTPFAGWSANPRPRLSMSRCCSDLAGGLGQRRATAAAKLEPWRILRPAFKAAAVQRQATVSAELCGLRIFEVAVRAARSPSPGRRCSTL
jgi:hypothetical protein